MKSTFKLIWSEEAVEGLKEIISYLENRFSENEIKDFIKEPDHQLDTICSFPMIFPKSEKLKFIRKCVVARRTSIYYKIEREEIILISIIDNRKQRDLEL